MAARPRNPLLDIPTWGEDEKAVAIDWELEHDFVPEEDITVWQSFEPKELHRAIENLYDDPLMSGLRHFGETPLSIIALIREHFDAPRCSSWIWSESGRDADLAPEGCTGISEIVLQRGWYDIHVGGHAAVADTYADNHDLILPAAILNYCDRADYDGDGWMCTIKEVVRWVPPSVKSTGVDRWRYAFLDSLTARARRAISMIEQRFREMWDYLNALYEGVPWP